MIEKKKNLKEKEITLALVTLNRRTRVTGALALICLVAMIFFVGLTSYESAKTNEDALKYCVDLLELDTCPAYDPVTDQGFFKNESKIFYVKKDEVHKIK